MKLYTQIYLLRCREVADTTFVKKMLTTIISRGCKLLQKQLGVEYKLAQEWWKNHVIWISNEYNQCGTRGFVTTKTKQYTCSA